MADPPDLSALAKRYVDLWQDQLIALAAHPELAEGLARVESAIGGLPRWRVETRDASAGTVTATRRTRFLRAPDDVTIRLEPTPGGTRVHVRSKSRFGLIDFVQNRRNVLELFAALRTVG